MSHRRSATAEGAILLRTSTYGPRSTADRCPGLWTPRCPGTPSTRDMSVRILRGMYAISSLSRMRRASIISSSPAPRARAGSSIAATSPGMPGSTSRRRRTGSRSFRPPAWCACCARSGPMPPSGSPRLPSSTSRTRGWLVICWDGTLRRPCAEERWPVTCSRPSSSARSSSPISTPAVTPGMCISTGIPVNGRST